MSFLLQMLKNKLHLLGSARKAYILMFKHIEFAINRDNYWLQILGQCNLVEQVNQKILLLDLLNNNY